jgi:XapX domain-containing protein
VAYNQLHDIKGYACVLSRVRRWSELVKTYVISLGAGVLVGVIYSLLAVRSPAPPVVALVGLAGMLIGEQIIPAGREVLSGMPIVRAWQVSGCSEHIFGALPGRRTDANTQPVKDNSKKAQA